MSVAFVVGDTVVSSEEFEEKVALGAVEQFRAEAARSLEAQIEFKGGIAKGGDLTPEPSGMPQFEPVGIGKPMSIEILTVYTGSAPSKWWGGRPDLLVASAIKGIETYDAQPRAINQIVQSIADRQPIQPSPLTNGSAIVYYTPSLVNGTLLCAFELAVAAFDKQTFQQISTLFSSAAGLPIFAPASAYLIAGSFLIKILADLGKVLFQPDPFLSESAALRFDTPNVPQAIAHQMIVSNSRDRVELEMYKTALVGPVGKQYVALVQKDTGKEYSGDAPYIVASLDGRRRPELDGFTPKLATAAIMEQFYRGVDAGGQVMNTLGSAMELYNDFVFREKAERMKGTIEALDPKSPTYTRDKEAFEKLRTAYSGNIRNALLRP